MNQFVLDASVVLRWVLDQELARDVASLRVQLEAEEATAVVPLLWHWETANGVVYHERRRMISAAGAETAWKALTHWAAMVETDGFPGLPVEKSFLLAREHRLTVYAAAYLELALRRGLPLATLDLDLRAAARAAGVPVDF